MFPRLLKVVLSSEALAAAAAISLASPMGAYAQLRMEFAPALGHYTPSPSQLPSYRGNIPCIVDNGIDCPVQQNGAVAVGGRLTAWFSGRSAIEGTVWYSPSRVTGFVNGFYDSDGNVVLGSLRLVVRQSLGPQAPAASILLMGGPIAIHRYGGYVATLSSETSFGGALGIALDVRPGRHFGFRGQIDDYLYNTEFAPSHHHDVVLSLSISPFGQRGERH
jgi:hypothetical protein